MQQLNNYHNPERVLVITYRQTLARDITRNFGRPDCKNYLDSYDDPRVWESPRLIIQLDSLLNLVYQNNNVMDGEGFGLSYDLIVLEENRSLMNHVDERAMHKKEIDIWFFFNEIMNHSKKDCINGRRH